jgi:hypothetical protein
VLFLFLFLFLFFALPNGRLWLRAALVGLSRRGPLGGKKRNNRMPR